MQSRVGVSITLAVCAVGACGREHFDPAANYAFVTSTIHDPLTFGADLAGADAICATAAAENGLLGTYRAYLGTTQVRAIERLGNARGWIRVDGEPFVDRVDDLAAGRIFHPLRIDEHGEDVGGAAGPVATSADAGGSYSGDCNGWSDPASTYGYGSSDGTTRWWTDSGTASCAMAAHLYCFGTMLDAPLVVTPATGRRAFVTARAFTPGGGLAAADALCANEAALAGLFGTFLAMLGTSTASAASRFDLSGPTWVRIDGIALADSPLAFVAGELATSPSVTALGTDTLAQLILTGEQPGLVPRESCLDWTTTAAATAVGRPVEASPQAFVTGGSPCNGAPIYCLEP